MIGILDIYRKIKISIVLAFIQIICILDLSITIISNYETK